MQQGYYPNQQPTPEQQPKKRAKPAKQKKTKKRKIWLYVLIAAIVILALDAMNTETQSAENSNSASMQTVESKPQSADSVIELIKTVLSTHNPSFYEVEGDSTGIRIKLAFDGVAADLYAIQQNASQENLKLWEETKNNFASMYSGIKTLLDSAGMNETIVEIDIMNDVNHENVLLMIVNGSVVYDVMAI